MINKLVLGIDLGTTNSVATYWDGKNYNIIKNNDSLSFPSIIEFTKHGKEVSKNYKSNVIRNFKRIIGQQPTSTDTLKLISDLNYDVNINDNIIYFYNSYENKSYTIEELNSLILSKIKKKAEKQLKMDINEVVITIPAHFNQIQRESVLISAKLSGLNCLRLVNEPTAAALSYGLNYHEDVNILVFDLGGGTFDLSVLNIDDGLFEVINTFGDNSLGGEDFTKEIIKDCLNKFYEKNKFYNINRSIVKKNIHKLREKCEEIKCNIKEKNFFTIENFYNEENLKFDLTYEISNNEIMKLFNPLLERIKEYLDKIVSLCNISIEDFNYIILVGGGSKLDCVRFLVNSYFKKESINNIDPEKVVSIGAGILGFTLVNPENEFSENIALVDVMSLSIGIESDDGKMTKIIGKGEKIPIKKYKYFTTEDGDQDYVKINIYQGERAFTKDNILIGEFNLKNIKKRAKGDIIIKVEINVDNNGVINIHAYENGCENKSSIIIENNKLLNDEREINRLIQESEKYSLVDNCMSKLRQKYVILQNQLDNLFFNCNGNIHISLSDTDKDNLNDHINKIKVKIEEIILPVKFIFDNSEFKEIEVSEMELVINNIKKLIKLNEKKYPSLTLSFDNTTNNENVLDKNDNLFKVNVDTTNNYNLSLKKVSNELLNKIEYDDSITKYSKSLILKFVNNFLLKLESTCLDETLYKENIDTLNEGIQNLLLNDQNIIKKYGKIDIIKKIINTCNINIQITNDYNEVDLFNLIYKISCENEINIDNLI